MRHAVLPLLLLAADADAFTLSRAAAPSAAARHSAPAMKDRKPFELKVDIPPRGTCNLRFKPRFEESEAIVVQYKLPFGLNVENVKGEAVVTKDGTGGERVGDVLRYCTKWELGLPAEGTIAGTVGSFGGLLKWQLGLLDVAKATSWQEVRARAPRPPRQ